MDTDNDPTVAAEIPCYAVIGKVNMGKSSVLATLLEEDDDRIIRISAEPGETTRRQTLSLTLNNSECLRFFDTPGFQQPIEAMRQILALHSGQGTPGLATLKRFVETSQQRFPDECQLLAPLLEGAGIIYVIDPALPIRDSFLAEIEILRWTGCPRLALLNNRSTQPSPPHEADWRLELGRAFNLVRGFNAHQARFAARRRLIGLLGQIEERHQASLDSTLVKLDTQWLQRRDASAEAIMDCLTAAFAWREKGHFDAADKAASKRLLEQLSTRYFKQIARLEYQCCKQLLGIYRHKQLDADNWEQLKTTLGDDLDWSSKKTWQRLGLTRKQLTLTGAAVGAGAGVGLDAATLGQTLGLAALVGGIGGGALSWFKSHALPSLSLTLNPISHGNQNTLVLGPPNNPNFGWILLDSLLLRYQQLLDHAHGRRDRQNLASAQPHREGLVGQLPRERRKTLSAGFDRWQKGQPPKNEDALLDAIRQTLEEVEKRLEEGDAD